MLLPLLVALFGAVSGAAVVTQSTQATQYLQIDITPTVSNVDVTPIVNAITADPSVSAIDITPSVKEVF